MRIWFGFSRPRKKHLSSSLIMRLTKSDFSHAYIRFESGNQQYVFHSIGNGTQVVLFSDFLTDNLPVEEVPKMVTDVGYFYGFISGADGKSYPFMQLIGCCLSVLFGLKKTIFDNGKSEAMCSETCAYIAEECCGVVIKSNKDLMHPKMLFEALQ